MAKSNTLVMTAAALSLAACGGGGGSSSGGGGGSGLDSYAAAIADLQSNEDLLTFTPEENLPTGSATYRGVVGFNTTGAFEVGETPDPQDLVDQIEGYVGGVSVTVDFADDTLDGEVVAFEDFEGNSVSGRLDIDNGTLTGTNTAGIAEGYDATAAGSIDGTDYVFDVEGAFLGDNGEGMSLYFDAQDDSNAIGSGLAAR